MEVDQFDRVDRPETADSTSRSARYSSLHNRQPAPSASTTTAIGRVGSRRRGDVGEVADVVDKLRGKVNAHNATQLPTVDGDQNE